MWTPDDQGRYNAAYYAAHREEEIERVRSRMQAALEFLRAFKRRPCADCGETFPVWVMDFDHREPATKSFQLTDGGALLKSRDIVLAEVAKCDVVCANCHAIRTYQRAQAEGIYARRPRGTSLYLARKTAHRLAQLRLLAELRALPCLHCGGTFPYYVMQFDHREANTKRYVVSRMPGRAGLETILAEVAKCDVVCSNCHRERTHRRRTIHERAGVL